jgi:beta-lactamase regulating signal transducer with metallopeptidase domain
MHRMLRELCLCSGHRGPVELTWSAHLDSPIAASRREICVPGAVLNQLTPDRQRSVLAHELAHIRRRDPEWLLVLLILQRVFFFQPLLRAASRRLHETAEFLCDQVAAEWTGNRISLARCLAEIGGWLHARKTPRTPTQAPCNGEFS